ncbi:MAG: hypothetical protein WC608_02210 [Parcubacteria group bacterium]
MKLKRTSLLFNNSLKKAIKEDPEVQFSKGVQNALKYINDILLFNFTELSSSVPNPIFNCSDNDGNVRENERLIRAFRKASRIASIIEYDNDFINEKIWVRMDFYSNNVLIFNVNASFHLDGFYTGAGIGIG